MFTQKGLVRGSRPGSWHRNPSLLPLLYRILCSGLVPCTSNLVSRIPGVNITQSTRRTDSGKPWGMRASIIRHLRCFVASRRYVTMSAGGPMDFSSDTSLLTHCPPTLFWLPLPFLDASACLSSLFTRLTVKTTSRSRPCPAPPPLPPPPRQLRQNQTSFHRRNLFHSGFNSAVKVTEMKRSSSSSSMLSAD